MLVHASIAENGKSTGGNPGDQTGKEVCTRTFYSKPWNIMMRYKSYDVASKASAIAIKLANSNLVGYDQSGRNTLYNQLKANNFDVDKYISSGVKTETDCSAFIYAVYCCLIPEMRSDLNAPTTSTMKSFYLKHGFTVYSESKYLTTDKNLISGDILVKEGSHVVMNTTDNLVVDTYSKQQFIMDIQRAIGAKVDGVPGSETLKKTPTVSKTKNRTHAVVRYIQKYLNAIGYNCGGVDGVAGNMFDEAIKKYQSQWTSNPDGEITSGGKTWKKLFGLL